LLRGDRRLLPGAQAPAGGVHLRRGSFRRPRPGREGRAAVAVAGGGGGACSLGPRARGRPPPPPPRPPPRPPTPHPGAPGPLARIGALTSLACGAIAGLGFCRYAGQGPGEVSRLRRLWGVLRPGDALLADRLTANGATIQRLQERGVELVSRLNKAHRKAD